MEPLAFAPGFERASVRNETSASGRGSYTIPPKIAEDMLLELMLDIYQALIDAVHSCLRKLILDCTSGLLKESVERYYEGNQHVSFVNSLDGEKAERKWSYLLDTYKKDRDNGRTTGSASMEHQCKYFDEIAAITINDPNINLMATFESVNANDEGVAGVYRQEDDTTLQNVNQQAREAYFTTTDIKAKISTKQDKGFTVPYLVNILTLLPLLRLLLLILPLQLPVLLPLVIHPLLMPSQQQQPPPHLHPLLYLLCLVRSRKMIQRTIQYYLHFVRLYSSSRSNLTRRNSNCFLDLKPSVLLTKILNPRCCFNF
jgi:hypothetical protein